MVKFVARNLILDLFSSSSQIQLLNATATGAENAPSIFRKSFSSFRLTKIVRTLCSDSVFTFAISKRCQIGIWFFLAEILLNKITESVLLLSFVMLT